MAALEAEHRSASRSLPRLGKPVKSSGSRQAVDSRKASGSTSGESVGLEQHAPEPQAQMQQAAQAPRECCDEEGVQVLPPPAPDPGALALEMLLVQGVAQAAAVSALRATERAYGETGAEQYVPSRSVGTVVSCLVAFLLATQLTQDIPDRRQGSQHLIRGLCQHLCIDASVAAYSACERDVARSASSCLEGLLCQNNKLSIQAVLVIRRINNPVLVLSAVSMCWRCVAILTCG